MSDDKNTPTRAEEWLKKRIEECDPDYATTPTHEQRLIGRRQAFTEVLEQYANREQPEALIEAEASEVLIDMGINNGEANLIYGNGYALIKVEPQESGKPTEHEWKGERILKESDKCGTCKNHGDPNVPCKECERLNECNLNSAEDTAKTCLQLLANATGAEFEDEQLAVDIIAETIKRHAQPLTEEEATNELYSRSALPRSMARMTIESLYRIGKFKIVKA